MNELNTGTRAAELPKTYDPAVVESRLYEFWEVHGLFQPSEDPTRPAFVITIPPPNVTGELHLGHALTYTIEDVVARYKRMSGFATVIVPGTDHASIAVHAKVEGMLAKEGVRRRFDVGRDVFLQRAWEWKARYATEIKGQFRALGESYDWTRERFTMDPAYYRAVMTMFVRLYDEGYIYRGSRVINWCPGCQTGISDIEVRPEERSDFLYFIRLPFACQGPESADGLTVATVRPETMFGDVAVAVHPSDERYAALVGRHLSHPLTGESIPIITDEFVDPAFGTGAVKITPAHDYADFEVGERHDLPMPVVITQHATMAEDVRAPYGGLSILDARNRAVDELKGLGFLVKKEPHVHNVPLCDRCGTVIEPLLSEQWFMRMTELAQPAIDVVKAGKVRFFPERWTRIYLEWMENIRPWNISRQLWWGQRIPIYHCVNGHTEASVDPPSACRDCGAPELAQDPDVLDTWFSSALWPFASLGWPDDTPDLRRFYPTSFMNTSSQILYLWIARMIMMGIHFMGEIPYPVVLINPTILNEKGQRMSKSLGTGIDPIDTVEKFGADATRFGVLSAGGIMQQEIRIAGYERAEDGRRFANKIWNASRLVLLNLQVSDLSDPAPIQFQASDNWILESLSDTAKQVSESLESYDLSAGLRRIYDFFWSEFADWYLEIAKLRLRAADDVDKATVRAVLWSALDRSLRLLHPYMPFVTEEIWQQLWSTVPPGALAISGLQSDAGCEPSAGSDSKLRSIMVAPWPGPQESRGSKADEDFSLVMDIVTGVRNLRAHYNVKPQTRLSALIHSPENSGFLRGQIKLIEGLSGLTGVEVSDQRAGGETEYAEVVVRGISVRLPLDQLTNPAEERARVENQLAAARKEQERLTALLANERFAAKAPEHVVNAERVKLENIRHTVKQLEEHIRTLPPSDDEHLSDC